MPDALTPLAQPHRLSEGELELTSTLETPFEVHFIAEGKIVAFLEVKLELTRNRRAHEETALAGR